MTSFNSKDELNLYFSKHIKETRESFNLTQKEFSELTGLSQSSVSQIETGSKIISTWELYTINMIFNKLSDGNKHLIKEMICPNCRYVKKRKTDFLPRNQDNTDEIIGRTPLTKKQWICAFQNAIKMMESDEV